MPTDELIGIAVEGLAPEDQKSADAKTIQVADLVLYYGKQATFEEAKSVVIIQFKYSIGSETVLFRTADAKKTVRKFAATFRHRKRKYGAHVVCERLQFELVTNRPVHPDFDQAIKGIASGAPLKGNANKQAVQFKAACGLSDSELAEFAKKFRVTGLAGSLTAIKQDLSRALADWNPAQDANARAQLGSLRQLLRDKAGSQGEGQNLIRRVDVLDKLEVQCPEDLLPCPSSFPEIGEVVEREQMSTAIDLIPGLAKPLLIHADGGLGKTVFMKSLAEALGNSHEVVLFDCFGGGAYRAPEDARHLPKRGLIHIVNTLAVRGLCDPLLPANGNVEDLVRAFRRRLDQAVATLRRASQERQLMLFIDAIDNAAEHAKDKGEDAFPTVLLESFHHTGAVHGVRLIVSSRSHRRQYFNHVDCQEFELNAFSEKEAEQYVHDRVPNATSTEIQVAFARSSGNPRILEHLVADRGLLDASELKRKIALNDFLRARIDNALREARKRECKECAINAFLAGLSVLPPPVPLEEYADAQGLELTAVRSFAADLAPLLDQTKHGLTFRDEPTETFVRTTYGTETDTLRVLADNLLRKQGSSAYAASALPGLLQRLDDGKRLFDLAFDDRFPTTITSIVGKRNIRHARLKAAVLYAARKRDFDHLVHLLLELSAIATVNERGRDYLLNHPDLVVASQDVEATRRLYETRTSWPGTKFARRSIAGVLAGDLNDACRHASSADEWLFHYYGQKKDDRQGGPERLDVAAIPLSLIAQNRMQDAADFLSRYADWYAYEVCEHVLAFVAQAKTTQALRPEQGQGFLEALKPHLGSVCAAISFAEPDDLTCRRLIGELAKACRKSKKLVETGDKFHRERDYVLEDGLMKAVATAISHRMHAEAKIIAAIAPHGRPGLWSYTDRFVYQNTSSFITSSALLVALGESSLSEMSILPSELVELGARIERDVKGDEFRKALKAEIEKQFDAQQGVSDDKRTISYETKGAAELFIDERLEGLMSLSHALSALLSSESGAADKPFLCLRDAWAQLRVKQPQHSGVHPTNRFFDRLGLDLLIFALWSRSDLGEPAVKQFVRQVTVDGVTHAPKLIQIVTILSKREGLQPLAGDTAVKARALAERENEIDHRASLLAQLSRAMLPASSEESAAYFRAGLEQMDAIGSGDHQFANELLVFAGELKGDELEEQDFHTLANICELNISSDQDKFPSIAFGRAMSRTSGNRMLARLGRWHDRSKVSIDYTLLPYLAAMLDQDKIDPRTALALLRLADPAEFLDCGTRDLAELIERKPYANGEEIVAELINQFGRNHPGVFMARTWRTLSEIAGRVFGKNAKQTAYLSLTAEQFEKVSDEANKNRDYAGPQDAPLWLASEESKERADLPQIVDETIPSDEVAVSGAVDRLNAMRHAFELKHEFFELLRKKLDYAERGRYIRIIVGLAELNTHAKLEELKACKMQWAGSSAALENVLRGIAKPLIQMHADDCIGHGYFSGSMLKEVSDLSGVAMPMLALELIQVLAQRDSDYSAFLWLSIASIICQETTPGQAQAALKRLLNSNAAKLSASVSDGAWREGLYASGAETESAAGLIWLMLGSPSAAERWRAAHSVRCLARFGKWDVIGALIEKLSMTNAHPFQAPELIFYFLHARLWLLIAVARIAMDYPERIAAYRIRLQQIALDSGLPHVLIRHFAARALLICISRGALAVSKADEEVVRSVNVSPFPHKVRSASTRDSFYAARPAAYPAPADDFHLDYDFDKLDVQGVADVFDVSRWKVKDALTEWVRKFDPTVKHMNESSGRHVSERDLIGGMTPQHHTYGQQLGWNGLFLVAGDLLANYPVANRPDGEHDEWQEWLDCQLLSRNDGLWLADGIGRPPLGTQVNLLEKGEKGLVLTSSRKKLLALLGIGTAAPGSVTVAGGWPSSDAVDVYICSALVPPRRVQKLARQIAKEDGFRVWVPFATGSDDGAEYCNNERPPLVPWIVLATGEERLDGTDSLGARSVMRRPRFTEKVNALAALRPADNFGRAWVNGDGSTAARAEAWRKNRTSGEGEYDSGNRLTCSREFLKAVLSAMRMDLLILLKLRHSQREPVTRQPRYWHTTVVLRVKHSLEFEFYPGSQNKLHLSRY